MRSSAAVAAALAVIATVHSAPVVPAKRSLSPSLQSILANTHNSDAYTYPTDLTRNIVPKPIHSHNDYWRDIPFYTALSAGCISIEADVWAINNTLYVGHDLSSLTETRTLASLYIDPILSVLQRLNPITPFIPVPTRNGVFDASTGQTLYLFIDVKTSGDATWPLVSAALEPLRKANYLAKFNGESVENGPVTVIGTGNTPISLFTGPDNASKPRDYFYDAPLASLNETQFSNITSLQSPIASTSLLGTAGYPANGSEGGFSDAQVAVIKSHIAVARSRGIGARYWETPAWPRNIKEGVWRELVDLGVALVNADELEEAADF